MKLLDYVVYFVSPLYLIADFARFWAAYDQHEWNSAYVWVASFNLVVVIGFYGFCYLWDDRQKPWFRRALLVSVSGVIAAILFILWEIMI